MTPGTEPAGTGEPQPTAGTSITSPEPPYWKPAEVDDALATMAGGGLILVKGDIGYGLFGTSEDAIRKMYRIKGRPYSNPCIFIGSLDVLDAIAEIPHPAIRPWIEQLASWTTCAVVLPARAGSPELAAMDPWVRSQAITNGTLAVFLRTGPYINEMVRRALADGTVFVGSSANKSSHGNTFHFADLHRDFLEEADLVVDHGDAALANDERKATTMLNFTDWSVKRRGVNADRIVEQFEILKTTCQAD
ncbi:MAG: L-threonylcarbamoyladenylate synthase [Frankia sp.]